MEKRIFLAIVISIAFLWGWAALAPKLFPELAKKPEPPKPAAVQKTTTAVPSTTSGTAAAPAAGAPRAPEAGASPQAPARLVAETEKRTIIDKPEYTAVLSNRGAQLISFQLKKYARKHSKLPVEMVKARHEKGRSDYPFAIQAQDQAFAAGLNTALYTVSERDDRGDRVVEYRYSDGKTTATKTFRFTTSPYLFDFNVAIAPPVPYRVVIGPGIRTLDPEEQDSRYVTTGNGVVERENKFRVIPREKGEPYRVFDSTQYIGLADNYFLTALRVKTGGEGILKRFSIIDAKGKKIRDDFYAGVNAVNGVVAGDAFFGPKETKLLDNYGFGDALQFGWLGVIARFLLGALVWLNRYTHNYGFAIVVLTILLKILLYPLQHKQNVSMKKMQRIQPKVEALRAKYKKHKTDAEQRQKMNMEQMQLYQKEGINPAAGCLPLVVQLPILWGFYSLLSHAIELRGAPWILWIHDLSDKDPTYILPILMTATMFIQTWIMPATGDPAQRRMFLIMPLFFGFLFKDFPCGLVLYWLVQNILTIIQQLIMNKWWKDHPAELQQA